MVEEKKVCPKCQGKGRIFDKDGTIRTCFDCLNDGQFDQHTTNVKDSGVEI